MIGTRRVDAPVTGLGRRVEPNAQLLQPQLHECVRAAVSDDDRTVSLSFVRKAWQGLHSVRVQYHPDAVEMSLQLGSRPDVAARKGYVVLRMVCEHTTIKLREPLRGRRLDVVRPGAEVSRSS